MLFRGKTIDEKWIEGFFLVRRLKCKGDKTYMSEESVISTGKCEISGAYGEHEEYFEYEVVPETIGQFTGLTDKNGTRIFEDDIVKVTDDNGSTMLCSCGIGCVCFYDGSWYIEGEVNDGLYDVDKIYYIEKIGNIHDNPELLGGESDGKV